MFAEPMSKLVKMDVCRDILRIAFAINAFALIVWIQVNKEAVTPMGVNAMSAYANLALVNTHRIALVPNAFASHVLLRIRRQPQGIHRIAAVRNVGVN